MHSIIEHQRSTVVYNSRVIVKLMIPGKYCMNNMDRCTCLLCFDFLKDILPINIRFVGTIVVETKNCGL